MISKFNQISNYSISLSKTVKDALKLINNNEIGACILIDENNFFISIITDGDLRRMIIKKNDINSPLNVFRKKKSLIVKQDTNQVEAEKIMNKEKILHLPIIKNKICKYIYVKNNFYKDIINTDFIILAGGFGKRLLPLTKNKPKALIEFLGKPLIIHILEKAINDGFINFSLLLHHQSDIIIKFLQSHEISKNININFIVEKKPLGTIGGLSLLKKLTSDHILVTNCDVIADLSYKNILHYHQQNNNKFTTATKKESFNIPYGVISSKNNKLIFFAEKPSIEFDINCGIYVIHKSIIKLITTNKHLNIDNLIKNILKKGLKINSYPLLESWRDIGQKEHIINFKLQ